VIARGSAGHRRRALLNKLDERVRGPLAELEVELEVELDGWT
jgi:hypothetical protein